MKNRKIIAMSLCCISILGATTIDELEPITVVAKSNTNLLQTPSSINIITKDEIRASGATNIIEVLDNIEGITSYGASSARTITGRQNVSIRGMDSKHTLLLLDGKRVVSADRYIQNSDFQYTLVPIEAIEKIEIIKGAMSSAYGSSALGGVINIITKKPKDSSKSNITINGGSPQHDVGGESSGAKLSLIKKLNDSFGFVYSGSYNSYNPVKNKDQITEIEGGKSWLHLFKGDYNISPNSQLSMTLIKGEEERDKMKEIPISGGYKIDKSHYALDYKYFSDNSLFKASLYRNSSDTHSDERAMTHELDEDIVDIEYSSKSFNNHYITVGGELRDESYNQDYDNGTTIGFNKKATNKSIFAQDEINLSDNWLLSLGARYDKHEEFASQISPKAYLVYTLSPNATIKGGYAKGFNAPTLTESSSSYKTTIGPYSFSGNDDLKPETVDSYEFGYHYDDDNQNYSATLFYNKLDNMIESTMIAPRKYQYQNISNVKTKGAELSFQQKEILPKLDMKSSYTYLKTEAENGEELAYRPNHKLHLSLGYQLPSDAVGNLDFDYIGKQKDATLSSIDSFILTNIQLSKAFSSDTTIRVGVKNITDKRLDNDYRYQLLGRYGYVQLEYNFGL